MDFVGMMVSFLKLLADICGNWGLAIIALTLIIRVALWHSSVVQQRSMRDMQKLQPKIKAIQDRYKNDPQKMQQKFQEFSKEHNYNPMGGCLPMLIQIPVFILLYMALISPQFTQVAGKSNFLFIDRLDATLRGTTAVPFDGSFVVNQTPVFNASKTATVYLGDKKIEGVKIEHPSKAISIQGEIKPVKDGGNFISDTVALFKSKDKETKLTPSEPIDLKMPLTNLGLSFDELLKVTKAQIEVIDTRTKEAEIITFKPYDKLLVATVPTFTSSSAIHYDVFVLFLLFIFTMWLSMKISTATAKNVEMDPQQLAMQKMMTRTMPLVLAIVLFTAPIPAGVLLYFVTSNIFQIAQTHIINRRLDQEDAQKNKVIEAEVIQETK